MLILIILIDVQYSKKAAFSFEKGLNHQKHSLGFLHTVKKIPPVKFPISPLPPHPNGREDLQHPHPLLLFGKPCLSNWTLLHVYVLSERPVNQLQRELVHEGLLY